MKIEVSAGVLFTAAVTLITMGISFLKEEILTEGSICVLTGFGILLVAFLLLKEGIIETIRHERA